MHTDAIIMERPQSLGVGSVSLVDAGADDVVVDMIWSGISTGTEKLLWDGTMPWFPGLEYPLVPGYEGVGEIVEAGANCAVETGSRVFVPGAACYRDAKGLFGASAARVVVPYSRVLPLDATLGEQGVLLSLAATAQHAIAASPNAGPTLIVGHGVVGRLIARLLMARGDPAPVVWEISEARQQGANGYEVVAPDDDPERAYATIYDASGDAGILDSLIGRIARQGEIVLAGFYSKPLSFVFPPAFMREARLRIAAEFKPEDLAAVSGALSAGRLSLGGLISHHASASDAEAAYRAAFEDSQCTKMVLDWR